MIKRNKRYCDRCTKEIPMVKDLTQTDINPHDILSLGFRSKTGRVLNKNYDLCDSCMNTVEAVLNAKAD